MTTALLSRAADASPVVQSGSADIFDAVTRGIAGLAVWRRVLSPEVMKAGDTARQSRLNDTVTLFCGDQSTIDHPFLARLARPLRDDLVGLMALFQEATRTPILRLRIETVNDDACRLFHIDNVRFRLITTYIGDGTQWLLPGLEDSATTNQPTEYRDFSQLKAGEVGLFRGKKCLRGAHVRHRSPPIAENPARLVLVIDEADDQ